MKLLLQAALELRSMGGHHDAMINFTTTPRWIAASLLVLLLAACETPVKSPSFADLTWNHLSPIRFAAGRVEVIDEYVAPLKSPHMEHEFPVVPEDAMRRWIADRIQAGGGDGTVRVIIRRASVTGHALKVRKGLKDIFYKDQAARYQGDLSIAVEVRSSRGFRSSHAEAQVSHQRTVPEEISPYDLDKVFFNMTSAMMKTLNQVLEAEIRKHMSKDLL